jgi:hypothetical protein
MSADVSSSEGKPYCDADGKSAYFSDDQLIDLTGLSGLPHLRTLNASPRAR